MQRRRVIALESGEWLAPHERSMDFIVLRLADVPDLETAAPAAHCAFYMDLMQRRQDAWLE